MQRPGDSVPFETLLAYDPPLRTYQSALQAVQASYVAGGDDWLEHPLVGLFLMQLKSRTYSFIVDDVQRARVPFAPQQGSHQSQGRHPEPRQGFEDLVSAAEVQRHMGNERQS